MRTEAFSEGKNLDEPEANEDQFLVLPGRGYAVIDGVTDISGRLVEGMRTGRLASRVVQQAATGFLIDPAQSAGRPEALIESASAALRAVYSRHGILEAVRAEPARRFSATLTMAIDLGPVFRFILVGDSGLRLNGSELVVVDEGLDLVTATLRQEAYTLVAEAGGDLATRRRVSRLCTFHGIGETHPETLPWLDEGKRAALYEKSLARCQKRFPSAPAADIKRLLDRGISGQTQFQNNTASPFSYASLDGFDIPMPLVLVFDRPRESIHSIELYTDGYFKPAATPSVESWEEAFDEVERVDPEKIADFPSVKGTAGRIRTDDRTVVIIDL
jgi:hypothetical protein